MSETIERVGNELMGIIIDIMENAVKEGDKLQDFAQRRDQLGRAAIEAMREPTEAMIDIGMQEFADPCWPENVRKGFGKMIDEALK